MTLSKGIVSMSLLIFSGFGVLAKVTQSRYCVSDNSHTVQTVQLKKEQAKVALRLRTQLENTKEHYKHLDHSKYTYTKRHIWNDAYNVLRHTGKRLNRGIYNI